MPSFIRPRLVSLGLSLNRTLVGDAGGGLVVCAVLARVCGGSASRRSPRWCSTPEHPGLAVGAPTGDLGSALGSGGPRDAPRRLKAGSLQRAGGSPLQSGTTTVLFLVQRFAGLDGGSRQHLAKTTAHGPLPEHGPALWRLPSRAETHPTGGALVEEHGSLGPLRSGRRDSGVATRRESAARGTSRNRRGARPPRACSRAYPSTSAGGAAPRLRASTRRRAT